MIPLHKVFMPDEAAEAVAEVLESGWVGEGKKSEELERAFGKRFGTAHVNALSSGTMGLEMLAHFLDLGPQDEVISTPMTCSATNIPFARKGAKIVWADIDPLTGNISPDSIAERITSRTKAIIIVHWGGFPCDIEGIRRVVDASSHSRPIIIEDAAHAMGAVYRGVPIGRCNYGTNRNTDFCMFSLQAIKHINSGDGGLLTSYRAHDHERLRVMRWYGIDRKHRTVEPTTNYQEWDIDELGFKAHMNDISAAIALTGLPYLGQILWKRRKIADFYDSNFELMGLYNSTGITPPPRFSDLRAERTFPAYWLYTIRVERRADFIKYMRENGIDVGVVHYRNDWYPIFKEFRCDNLPNLDSYFNECVSIPVGQWVTREQAEKIIDTIRRGW